MPYNPFETPLGETLQPEDLKILVTQQVAEGYYIEYKRELPTAKKIAHSLASFANTYGGWYIVGVETNEHNVATQISGFNPASHPDPIAIVRDVVRHHIDPVPIFFPQVITLDDGHLVLAVYVPENQETPFITKDGRLYRRTCDSSEPVPETNRYALDQLVERGKEVSKRFARFAEDKRSFSKAEEDGWLKIYVSPYPFGLIEQWEVLSTSGIANLITASKQSVQFPFNDSGIDISGNIEFNAAYLTPNSVVLRQTNIQNEAFNSLSIELDVFGRAKMFIPLQKVRLEDYDLSSIRSSIAHQQLSNRLEAQPNGRSTHLYCFDIGRVCLVIAVLTNYYLRRLSNPLSLTGFQVSLELDNVWRYIPFYDFDSWGSHVEHLGLPVLMENHVYFPPQKGKGYIVDAGRELWISLCVNAARSCGLPSELFANVLGQVLADASTDGKYSNKIGN